MKRKFLFSLRYKQLLVLLLGALISYGIYHFTQTVGDFLINKYYLNNTAVTTRMDNYQNAFDQYVNRKHVSIKNVRAISKWVNAQKYVYLTIYAGDEIIYESGWWNDKNSASASGTIEENESSALMKSTSEELEVAGTSFKRSVRFIDGIYKVSIVEFSEIKWYDWLRYLSWGNFFLVLFLVLMVYNHRVISKILRLSKEVSAIENGNLGQSITHKGNDEISLLALNADNMRHSILSRLQSEKDAWEANSELITSMSHDIRTPLTSLIGYLEILDSKDYRTEEQLQKYIRRSKEKSIQLKELSEKLFQYFLVFGKEKIKMQMESFEVSIIFQQLLCEHVFDLENGGFEVKTDLAEQSGSIRADIYFLKRLFDNLFSNVAKYASPNEPVMVIGKIVNGILFISISNGIRTDSALVESTNIGLKTCKKIVEQMDGFFEIHKSQTRFEVSIIFPVELE